MVSSCKPGFQLFKDILNDCTPEKMSEITTVPAKTIRRIARELVQGRADRQHDRDRGAQAPAAPGVYIYYRGAQAHKYATMTNHAFKMVNMLLGNIDAPGGHVGVTLDDKMQDRGHIKPGENGMIDVVTHPFGPPPPFSYPPNETQHLRLFPVRLDSRPSEPRGAQTAGEIRSALPSGHDSAMPCQSAVEPAGRPQDLARDLAQHALHRGHRHHSQRDQRVCRYHPAGA